MLRLCETSICKNMKRRDELPEQSRRFSSPALWQDLSLRMAVVAQFRKRRSTPGKSRAGLLYSLRKCLGRAHTQQIHILEVASVSRVVAIIPFEDLAPGVWPKLEKPAVLPLSYLTELKRTLLLMKHLSSFSLCPSNTLWQISSDRPRVILSHFHTSFFF